MVFRGEKGSVSLVELVGIPTYELAWARRRRIPRREREGIGTERDGRGREEGGDSETREDSGGKYLFDIVFGTVGNRSLPALSRGRGTTPSMYSPRQQY